VRLFTPQSQTSLSDLWKIRDSDNSPLIYASTAVTLISDAQKALVPVGYDRSHEYAPDEYSPDEYA
jgi:hypothetical protein